MTKNIRKRKKPTIRTIAAEVDLSPTTVSLALRGDDSIPPETRDRVIAAAQALNYIHTPRRQRNTITSRQLVYIIKDYGDQPVSANPFYGKILNGVEHACQEAEVRLHFVVMNHDYPEKTELPPALTSRPDGVIVSSPYPRAVVDRIAREARCPLVLIDNMFPASPYDTVMADDFGGGYQAAQHLLENGHCHILAVSGLALSQYHPPSFNERYRGYEAACIDYGTKPLPLALIPPEIEDQFRTVNQEKFKVWLQSLMQQHPQITGFFGTGDLYAIRLIHTLTALGYRVPEDYSVIGCDDYEMSGIITPPLTTIRLYQRVMGQVATQQLLRRIIGGNAPPLHLTVGTDLIRRGSTQSIAH